MSRDLPVSLNPVVRDLFAYLFAIDRSAPPEAIILWVALALLPVLLAIVVVIGACSWVLTHKADARAADATAAAVEEGENDGRTLRTVTRVKEE